MLEPRELDMPQWFGEVVPGSAFSKTVSVRNTTKLPFAFEWALSKWVTVELGSVVGDVSQPGARNFTTVTAWIVTPVRGRAYNTQYSHAQVALDQA